MKQRRLGMGEGRVGAGALKDSADARHSRTHGTLTLNKAIIIEFTLDEEDAGK